MRIKEIEILGFKSFVDKTNLLLLPGLTVMVGPNGCGKSNIVDAIRWAMGEQSARHLRGRCMEDIIFNGSETRKPLGMAEVSLIFENNDGDVPAEYRDYSEIMITRRIYRSGENEYFINKVPCRLKDITEFFMDTGIGTKSYSIVEQGKIEMLINAKPLDRRMLLEEVAGVLKYKNKKREALTKLESTRQNLLRVNDILSELEAQIKSLRRQAGKLRGYQRLKEFIKKVDLMISSKKYSEIKLKKEETEKQFLLAKDEEIMLTAEINKIEAELEKEKVEQFEREQLLNNFQKEFFESTYQIQKLSSNIEYSKKELSEIQERIQTNKNEISILRQQIEEESDKIKSLEDQEKEYFKLLNNNENMIYLKQNELKLLKEKFQEIINLEEKERSDLIEVLTEITNYKNTITHLEKNMNNLKRRSEKILLEKQELSNKAIELNKKLKNLSEECKFINEEKYMLEIKSNQIDEEYKKLEKAYLEKEEILRKSKENIQKYQIELRSLQDLERSFEGYSHAVRFLMTLKEKERNHDLKLLADIIEINPGYEIAVEAVLGEKLQSIVVKDWDEVWKNIELLKMNKVGKCIFIPAKAYKNEIQVNKYIQCNDYPPNAQPLLNFIKCEDIFFPIIQYLLSNIWLVNDFKDIFNYTYSKKLTFVTKDGEVLDPTGLVFGGSKDNLTSGILIRKSKIKNIYKIICNLDKEYKLMESLHQEIKEKLKSLKEENEKIIERVQELTLNLINTQKDFLQAKQNLEEIEERIKLLNLEEEEHIFLIKETVEEYKSLLSLKNEKEIDYNKKEELLKSLKNSIKDINDKINSYENEIISLKIHQASLSEKREHYLSLIFTKKEQLKELQSRLESLEKKTAFDEKHVQEIATYLADEKKKLDQLIQSQDILNQKVQENRGDVDKGIEKIKTLEEKLHELRSLSTKLQNNMHEINLKVSEFNLNMEYLINDIKEKYQLEIDILWEKYLQEAKKENRDLNEYIRNLKRKLESFGEINYRALDELEEIEKRFSFISKQKEDLIETIESLKKVINKINYTIREKFQDTFNQVNEKFQLIFPKLFRGGKAQLILNKEDDILESGIEIYAQPPGKRLQNLDLLSGGEKSLASVAFLLALFMVKPAPFCLLDEVDSPLDDLNTMRFIEQLKEMVKDSQFILITHNKKTMEAADNLYGITMEEKGVSKVVSVKLN